jgi:hypothetical protein
MIEGFSTIIQNDIVQVSDYFKGKGLQNKEQKERIKFAAGRMLTTLGMAIGLFICVSALKFVASEPAKAILRLALGVAIYAFQRDIFIICKNQTDQANLPQLAIAVGKARWHDITDWWKGKKNLDSTPRQAITEGTFFRSAWDKIFTE